MIEGKNVTDDNNDTNRKDSAADKKDELTVDPVKLRIKEIMEKKGLISSSFADKINVSRSNFSHVLNGRHAVSRKVALKVLDAFPDINSDWLLFGKNPMYNREKSFMQPQQEPALLFDSTRKISDPPKKEPPVAEYPQKPENGTVAEPVPKIKRENRTIAEPIPLQKQDNETIADTDHQIKTKKIAAEIFNDKKIDRIVIFYKDKTFISYSPEE